MEANVFITKLKADGSKNDLIDLNDVLKEYKELLTRISARDKGSFSLNVLCILCRNLEKVPSWRTTINCKALVTLSVECLRSTQTLDHPEQVKTLACVYHIHKHVVRQNTQVPPELVLKLSYMPFETDTLITEYSKTYWNIIADRIIYIERLKSMKLNIVKTFEPLTEHVLKVIRIYTTVQLCSSILMFLVKKFHYLYSDVDAIELNNVFGKIFDEIQSKSDLRSFRKLSDKDLFDIYVKMNDCLYVVAENSSRLNFTDSVLNTVVQTCLSLICHQQDLLHCFQNIYLNGVCTILDDNQSLMLKETVLSNFVATCEMSEKLGYTKAMNATYPYINQFLRLYIDYNLNNQRNLQKQFPLQIQIACLKLIEFLLNKLRDCNQILKCENCTVKSGLHDALRLSFSVKSVIAVPLQQNMSISKTLPTYLSIVLKQYSTLKDLCTMGCVNYDKCYRKLQSDVHNTAILLNKSQYHEYSIKLFEIYVENELLHFKTENDLKNVSRALYNKSICELDFRHYEQALQDAYLSLIFAYPDGLTSEKYMSLVIDIKAKVLKTKEDVDQSQAEADDLQMMTVLDACALALERKMYGSLKPFFCNLKFSSLLRHEYRMYATLWPSIAPIAGVWRTLHDLTQHDVPWLNVSDEDVRQTLQDVILETPTVVRTVHNEQFAEIITDLLQGYAASPPEDLEARIFLSALMFLKAELDLAAAATKYRWKLPDQNPDPDEAEATRTLAQEHEAARRAVQAVGVWSDVAEQAGTAPPPANLRLALQTAQVLVPQLLYLYRTTHGLQLAHACCVVATHVDDKISFATNASALLYHANIRSRALTQILQTASVISAQLLATDGGLEAALVLLTHCAMYHHRTNSPTMAARLLQFVQSRVYHSHLVHPDLNLDLAMGCLYEAQTRLCKETGLSDVIGVHRHYLIVGNSATKWTSRRLRALYLKLHITYTGLASTILARRLLLWRRARGGAGAALITGPAGAQGALFLATTDPGQTAAARVKIDNRLKYILGVQASSDQPSAPLLDTKPDRHTTPKDLETMLENVSFKNTRLSPTFNCIDRIPRFKLPCFFEHVADCQCYACENLYSLILACQTVNLEASTYFKAKEYNAARHYFEGSVKCLKLAEKRLESMGKLNYAESYVNDIAKIILLDKFREVQIEALVETAFFELSQANYKDADEHIVRIHEILQENVNVDAYLKNDVLNLMTTSARLRKLTKRTAVLDIELELESLHLSPPKQADTAKTPEEKAKNPPKMTRNKAKAEEVPNKRRVIKLNLDENSTDEKETKTRRASKKAEFKIPVPVTAKPVLENVTPVARKKPDILVTQAKDEPSISLFEFATPKPSADKDKSEFFTPLDEASDQFFTPMSTLRTYKPCLRRGIVKNLVDEFSTPKSEIKTKKTDSKTVETTDKENKCSSVSKSKSKKVEVGSMKSLKDKRNLKRATSPGKLEKDDKKSSRLRNPVKFNLDE